MVIEKVKINISENVTGTYTYYTAIHRRSYLTEENKVLCSMFLLAILGVDPVQNLAKYKRWLSVLKQLTNKSIAIM